MLLGEKPISPKVHHAGMGVRFVKRGVVLTQGSSGDETPWALGAQKSWALGKALGLRQVNVSHARQKWLGGRLELFHHHSPRGNSNPLIDGFAAGESPMGRFRWEPPGNFLKAVKSSDGILHRLAQLAPHGAAVVQLRDPEEIPVELV